MIDYTINGTNTIAGDGKDMILDGLYQILHQLGEGGIGAITVHRRNVI